MAERKPSMPALLATMESTEMRKLNIEAKQHLNAKDVSVITELGESQYRPAEGLNKSLLVEFMRSPRHYIEALNAKKKPSESMEIGTALHCELLQGKPSDHYAVIRKVDLRKNADKEYYAKFQEENIGKTIIDEDGLERMMGMKNALLDCPKFKKMYERITYRELAIFSTRECQHGDVRLKGMLDAYVQEDGIILDIKSAESAHINKFKYAFKDFRYDIQQVQYTYLAMVANLPFSKFEFAVVENKKPYNVAYYTLSKEQYLKAFDEWRLALDSFSFHKNKEDFNYGYPTDTYELTF